jgi:hypothetical protein
MGEQIFAYIGMALSAFFGIATGSDGLRHIEPYKCMHKNDDYSFVWWAYGLRDQRHIQCYQTGNYGLAIDTDKVHILHLGIISNPANAEEVLTQDNDTVFNLPPAELGLNITVAEKTYRCVRSTKKNPSHNGPRIIDSGYFFQRCDIYGLEFADDKGDVLLADGRFEVSVWSDHLGLALQVWQSSDSNTEKWENAKLEISLTSMGKTFSDTKVYDSFEVGEITQVALALQAKADGWYETEKSSTPVYAETKDQTCPVEYDPILGCYKIDINNARPDDLNNDSLERIKIRLSNHEKTEKKIHLMFTKEGKGLNGSQYLTPVIGISPILCNINGNPLGIPVQISKNWHSQEIEIPFQGAWFHGFTTLNLPPESEVNIELRIAYAHWGGLPSASHAQLCLIGWGNNQLWNEAAIGAWGESICFEPDQGQVGGSVLDTRPLMVYSMNSDEPTKWGWTNNVGGADFLIYYDKNNKKQWHIMMHTLYRRYCPNFTEVSFAGVTQDYKVKLQYTVSLYRCDDITRGIYKFRYDVLEPVDFSRFVIFQCGGDDYSYTGERRFAIGDESGLIKEWDTRWGGNVYRTQPFELSGEVPWLSMHEAASRDKSKSGAWANRGVIIRNWKAQLGGKSANPYVAERGAHVRGEDTSLFDILPPDGLNQLLPGDFVEAEVEHVVVPQFAKDYYGTNKNLHLALQKYEDTWRMIHRDAIGNDLSVKVKTGKLLRSYPIMIELDKAQSVEFTVIGGIGYVPITFCNLNRYDNWKLVQIDEDGKEIVIDQSVHGNDFWQTDYDPVAKRWSQTYNVNLDKPDDQIGLSRFIFLQKSK